MTNKFYQQKLSLVSCNKNIISIEAAYHHTDAIKAPTATCHPIKHITLSNRVNAHNLKAQWTSNWQFNSKAMRLHAHTTLQRQAYQRLTGCSSGELLSISRGHVALRTYNQHMQIQPGSRYLLLASEEVHHQPFASTRALENSLRFSLQPSRQRTGYEGF